ncbi:MAG: anthranilate phosphoribosyltransferase [bacterium]
MKLTEAAQRCRSHQELRLETIPSLVDALLDATVEDNAKADFLAALAQKNETANELAAFVQAILPLGAQVPGVLGEWNKHPILDCCGTGGGGLNIVNISTGIMFILAAAGVPVVKHGAHGFTKKSGSADVLKAMNIRIDLSPLQVRQCLEELNLAFIYAPAFYPVFKAVAPVRKALAASGQRTIFNLLGPLLNPVRPQAQLMGVFQEPHLALFSAALEQTGCRRYLVAYGKNASGKAIGEVSADGPTRLIGKLDGKPCEFSIERGEEKFHFEELLVQSPEESAAKLIAVLEGKEQGITRAMLVVNAAAALFAQGKTSSFQEGCAMAASQLDSGATLKKLRQWQNFKARA